MMEEIIMAMAAFRFICAVSKYRLTIICQVPDSRKALVFGSRSLASSPGRVSGLDTPRSAVFPWLP